MNISFTKHTLANGLDVIIHEDRDCPIVALNIWYHVGSKNERPGMTGFAHLVEHLMFEGSEHYNGGYFQPLQQAGAAVNGSTNADRTNYWEVVPTNALELALWMESDRMGCLLPAVTSTKFQLQRDVVLNERRQNYENRPYGLVPMVLLAALYPPGHPYRWPTIGASDDIRTVTLEDAERFLKTYYHPGNASLALAGDVKTGYALALIRQYFEEIERGPAAPAVVLPDDDSVSAEQRLLLEDRIELPRLYLAWRSPAFFAKDDAELDLFADLLANGKTSRLYRALVHERRIATEVAAVQSSRELSGFFQILATAAPGRALTELEGAITAEIQRVTSAGVAEEELERNLALAEAGFVYRLQTVGGFGGKSDQLNAYNVFLGNPGSFERDLARYRTVTPESLTSGVATWLGGNPRVALSVVPRQQRSLALEGSSPVVVA